MRANHHYPSLAPALLLTAVLAAGCLAACADLPADAGPGGDPGGGPTRGPTSDPGADPVGEPLPPWAWDMPYCASYQPEQYHAPDHRVAVEVAAVGEAVTEVYEVGWGTRAIEEIRQVVRVCAHYEYGGEDDPEAFREQNTVVETGFAADESLLVETVRLAPPAPVRTSCTEVVREGETVTTTPLATCGAGRA